MTDPTKQELIMIRRYEADEEHHKGGVWKIAHADFMTAMMAFFLVMWLISVSDKDTRQAVANYFNPVQLAESVPDRKGLKEPQNKSPESPEQTPPKDVDAQKQKGPSKGNAEDRGGPAPPAPRPRYKEGVLFQDPYAILAKIAAEPEQDIPSDNLGIDGTTAEVGQPGINGGEAQRDPFDPLYWQVTSVPRPRTETPGSPETTTPVPRDGTLDVLAPKPSAPPQLPEKGKEPKPSNKAQAAAPQANPKTAQQDGSNPAQAPAPAQGQAQAQAQAQAQDAPKPTAISPEAELKAEIAKALQNAGGTAASPRVEVNRTGDGTLISITDDINFSMFALGSAEPQPKVVRAMEQIAKILSSRPGKIIIQGHTDARPFRSPNYDNWRLSTARAHMASYMLVRGGLDEARIERVEGHADRNLKNKVDPYAAENRRIEILIRESPR